jgi:hypothetical protein
MQERSRREEWIVWPNVRQKKTAIAGSLLCAEYLMN